MRRAIFLSVVLSVPNRIRIIDVDCCRNLLVQSLFTIAIVYLDLAVGSSLAPVALFEQIPLNNTQRTATNYLYM